MSRLEDISVQYRKENLARNEYNNNDIYEAGHENALSDGDEKGKGDVNGSVGGATDIQKRKESFARNKYNRNNPYDASNA